MGVPRLPGTPPTSQETLRASQDLSGPLRASRGLSGTLRDSQGLSGPLRAFQASGREVWLKGTKIWDFQPVNPSIPFVFTPCLGLPSAVQCSAVQCSAVQCSAVQCSAPV